MGGKRWVNQKQTAAEMLEVDVRIGKKMIFIFFIFIWKYFLFEYNVLDKIRLDCKACLSPHTYLTYITSLPQTQKLLSNLLVYIDLMGYKLEWTPQN